MARYLGRNSDGTHRVQLDDGTIMHTVIDGLPDHMKVQLLTMSDNVGGGNSTIPQAGGGIAVDPTAAIPLVDPSELPPRKDAARPDFVTNSAPVIPGFGPPKDLDIDDPSYSAASEGMGGFNRHMANLGNTPISKLFPPRANQPASPAPSASVPTSPAPQAQPPPGPHFSTANGSPKMRTASPRDQVPDPSIAAIEQQRQAAEALARDQATVGTNASNQMQANIDSYRNDFNAAHRQAMETLSKASAAQDAFMNSTVDPDHYWGKKNTGDKVLAALSMIIGGIGGGLSGQPNAAAKVYDDAVNSDIEHQKWLIEHNKEASKGYMELYGKFHEAGMTSLQAMQFADTAIKEKAAQDILNVSYQHGGQAAAAQAATALADHFRQIQQDKIKNGQLMSETAKNYAEAKKALREAENAGKPGRPAGLVRDENGNLQQAIDEQHAQAFEKELYPPVQIRNDIADIEKMRADGILKNQADLQAAAGILSAHLANFYGEHDSQRVHELLQATKGDPAQYFALTPGSSWEGHKRELLKAASRQISEAHKHLINYVPPPPPPQPH